MTEEERERLAQARERNEERKQAFTAWRERGIIIESLPIPDMITDIDFLLSLLDSQAASIPYCFNCRQARGWQPIETAPRELISDGYASKHGPRILAFPVRGIVAGVRWFQSKVTPNAVGFVSDWQEVCEPTHWMPLPPAPLVSDCDPDG